MLGEVEEVAGGVAIIREGRVVDVADVRALRARAGQEVLLRFADAVALEAFADLPGVHDAAIDPRDRATLTCLLRGDPMPLLTAAARPGTVLAAQLRSRRRSLLGAALTLVPAIGLGARLVAGPEEDGTLELELGAPVSRGRVYGERLAALWMSVLVPATALSAVLVALSALLDLGLDPVDLVAAGTGLLFFGGALGTVAFAVGAATGRRGPALGTAAGLAVVSYVLSYLGPLVEAPWMERVSPFHWYIGAEPLENGFDLPGLGLLAASAAVAAAGGAVAFGRRDVMV